MAITLANRLPRQLRELIHEGMDAGVIVPADASEIAFAYPRGRGGLPINLYAALIRRYISIKLKDKLIGDRNENF